MEQKIDRYPYMTHQIAARLSCELTSKDRLSLDPSEKTLIFCIYIYSIPFWLSTLLCWCGRKGLRSWGAKARFPLTIGSGIFY